MTSCACVVTRPGSAEGQLQHFDNDNNNKLSCSGGHSMVAVGQWEEKQPKERSGFVCNSHLLHLFRCYLLDGQQAMRSGNHNVHYIPLLKLLYQRGFQYAS